MSATLASSLAVPAVHFSPFGAASVSFNHHYYTCCLNDDQFHSQKCLKGHERKSSDALFEFLYSDVFDQDKDNYFVNLKLSSEVVLLKANRGLEEKYIDYVSSASHKRILPVGPLVSDIANNEDDSDMILQWLSKKEQHSTVYISFGSEYFLSKQEIEEIAKGVELSGSNFIWIIRFPTMENTVVTINELLPEGFLERVKDRGMVLSGWAPQGSILRHPSTGAFLSHCGWSSLNESIYYGVPVIGMSMKLNMFIDAKMLVDAGGCVEVVRDAGRVYYKGEEIGKAIKEVMSGKRMRERELNT